jgi:hypothetical protein
MAKSQKHPSKMTTDEAIKSLFHPKVVEGMKQHVSEIDSKRSKVVKKGATK